MRGSTRFVRCFAVSAAVLAGLMAAAGPAAAAGHIQSPNFAGYQFGIAPTSGAVSFKLPALTCDVNASGIVPNLTFTNFATSKFTSGGVYVQCVGGVPNYAALIEINNRFSSPTPNMSAGDSIHITISASASATTVTITDKTNASSVSTTVKGAGGGGPFTGASVGDSKIGSPGLPVSTFSTLTFTGIRLNGAKVPLASVVGVNDMYDGATLQISSGNLSAGGKFVTTFAHV